MIFSIQIDFCSFSLFMSYSCLRFLLKNHTSEMIYFPALLQGTSRRPNIVPGGNNFRYISLIFQFKLMKCDVLFIVTSNMNATVQRTTPPAPRLGLNEISFLHTRRVALVPVDLNLFTARIQVLQITPPSPTRLIPNVSRTSFCSTNSHGIS